MNSQSALRALGLIILAATGFTISGCADSAAIIRSATYPPEFKYVSGQELRFRMDQMARELQFLDQALLQFGGGQLEQQQQVVDSLRNIEGIASTLQAGEAGSNHRFLQNDMSYFISNVSQARNAATQNPPRYYLAGRVAGGCVNCHNINRD